MTDHHPGSYQGGFVPPPGYYGRDFRREILSVLPPAFVPHDCWLTDTDIAFAIGAQVSDVWLHLWAMYRKGRVRRGPDFPIRWARPEEKNR